MLPDPGTTMEVMPAAVATWQALPPGERPCLLDCRQPEEVAICHLEGSLCIPMAGIPAQLERLQSLADRGIVVYCHHGMRSLQVTAFLRARGLGNCFSMAGGIELWAREIEPGMARY